MRGLIIMLLSVSLSFANCVWRESVNNGFFMRGDTYHITYICLNGYLFINAAWQGNTLEQARADGVIQVFEIDKDGKSIPKKCDCTGRKK